MILMSKARTHHIVRTWIQLYDRLGRQPLSKTKESRIVLKNKDGSFSPLVLKYDENGSSWWLEKEETIDCVEETKEIDIYETTRV